MKIMQVYMQPNAVAKAICICTQIRISYDIGAQDGHTETCIIINATMSSRSSSAVWMVSLLFLQRVSACAVLEHASMERATCVQCCMEVLYSTVMHTCACACVMHMYVCAHYMHTYTCTHKDILAYTTSTSIHEYNIRVHGYLTFTHMRTCIYEHTYHHSHIVPKDDFLAPDIDEASRRTYQRAACGSCAVVDEADHACSPHNGIFHVHGT
jgi:hypothetical protein